MLLRRLFLWSFLFRCLFVLRLLFGRLFVLRPAVCGLLLRWVRRLYAPAIHNRRTGFARCGWSCRGLGSLASVPLSGKAQSQTQTHACTNSGRGGGIVLFLWWRGVFRVSGGRLRFGCSGCGGRSSGLPVRTGGRRFSLGFPGCFFRKLCQKLLRNLNFRRGAPAIGDSFDGGRADCIRRFLRRIGLTFVIGNQCGQIHGGEIKYRVIFFRLGFSRSATGGHTQIQETRPGRDFPGIATSGITGSAVTPTGRPLGGFGLQEVLHRRTLNGSGSLRGCFSRGGGDPSSGGSLPGATAVTPVFSGLCRTGHFGEFKVLSSCSGSFLRGEGKGQRLFLRMGIVRKTEVLPMTDDPLCRQRVTPSGALSGRSGITRTKGRLSRCGALAGCASLAVACPSVGFSSGNLREFRLTGIHGKGVKPTPGHFLIPDARRPAAGGLPLLTTGDQRIKVREYHIRVLPSGSSFRGAGSGGSLPLRLGCGHSLPAFAPGGLSGWSELRQILRRGSCPGNRRIFAKSWF